MMGNLLVIIKQSKILILLFCTTLFGCSSELKTYPTTGKVIFKNDGKPFTGRIYFEAVKPPHTRSMAYIKQDGSFSLSTVKEGSGAVEGEQIVRVDPDIPDGPDYANRAKIVARKYLDFPSSPIRINIEPHNKNYFLIELERP